jgi:hypothetical protein
MARTVDLLVGTDEPLSAVTAVIERALGGTFTGPSTGGEPAHLAHDRTDIYAGPHHFDDGDLQAPDGTPLDLHSQYPYWVEVRDLDRDPDRQLATARQIYEALKASGKWKLVLADDMQKVIDMYEPAR